MVQGGKKSILCVFNWGECDSCASNCMMDSLSSRYESHSQFVLWKRNMILRFSALYRNNMWRQCTMPAGHRGFCLWLTFSQTLTSAHTLVIFFFFPSAWHICLFGQVSSFSPACQRLYYSPLQVLNLSAQAHITPNKSKTKYYYSCNTTSSSCRM